MKQFSEGKALSEGIAKQFDSFMKNINELEKMLTEATEYVKVMPEFMFIRKLARPRSIGGVFQPTHFAFSLFSHNITESEEAGETGSDPFYLALMILFYEPHLRTNMKCITLSVIRWCLDDKGSKQNLGDYELAAVASGSRDDWCKYSVSTWSDKVIKAVQHKNKQVSYVLHIPVGCIEKAEDFKDLLEPCIEALVEKSHEKIEDLPLYVPIGIGRP